MHTSKRDLDQLMSRLNRRNYGRASRALDACLSRKAKRLGNYCMALEGLVAHQIDQGVVVDSLRDLERFQFVAPDGSGDVFYAHVNPARLTRHAGIGRRDPPPGWSGFPRPPCVLCAENIMWQQRYTQFPFTMDLPSGRFRAWTNPFPLGEAHVTIAAMHHVPQTWQRPSRRETILALTQRLQDVAWLAHRCPGFLIFENGDGAGASVKGHHHYQALRKWAGLRQFPLEAAAERQMPAGGIETRFVLRDYPVSAMVCRGPISEVLTQAAKWGETWLEKAGDWRPLTANIIASRDPEKQETVSLFLVPRNASITRSPCLGSAVASLEIAGELVFATETERQAVAAGQITFDKIWQCLAASQDVASRQLLASL